ncbi:succinate dehydrogenase cytochrome b subunit [Flavobacterium sp. NKUCC04_CG]|uniref:succinate dehydrogenase cytochrome b subunit n=1 Tax=Flavobacterium sp. NKUCC04_CG TaxID=2842121 RepID=UPI001C5B172D|nr:succinate dehydrogenase cytochrome b subunit [Flavobacterium sp. NKUCC04_CG]MBW3519121.1 succinate dehydrogenase cytochrome b subunit [Flavobacterium sp. NKUCC04_CG]
MQTLTRKIILCFTGLFLCFFLVIHLLGNLQLFLPPEEAHLQFNAYSHFLSGNPLIKLVSYGLYASIIAHVVYALIITVQNKKSGGNYQKDQRGRSSKWYSRNMGVLGTIILVFLIIHFKNFWYEYKFGSLPLDANGNRDLYQLVVEIYQIWWYVIIYVVAMIALGYHLLHGFFSAIRTLGVFHPKFVKGIRYFGIFYSLAISLGFAIIPIYIYFTKS